MIANVPIGWGDVVGYGPVEGVEHGTASGVAAQDGSRGVGTASLQDDGMEFWRVRYFAAEADAKE